MLRPVGWPFAINKSMEDFQTINEKSLIRDFIHPTLALCIMFMSFLIALYVPKKCPFMVQLSSVLCIISWMLKFLQLKPDITENFQIDAFEAGTLDYLHIFTWLLSVFQQNDTTIYVIFLALLCIRFGWCEKLNIVRDSSLGFKHLLEKSMNQGYSTKTFIQEIAERKRREALNIPPVFPNGWIPVIESRDLKIGEKQAFLALGQSLVVFRGYNGKPYILNSFYGPLNIDLAMNGIVFRNGLKCLTHTSELGRVKQTCSYIFPDDEKNKLEKIKIWPCDEANGSIYIWYNADGFSPSWNIPVIVELSNGLLIYRGRTEHKVYCHIQEMSENGADTSHFAAVHKKSAVYGKESGKLGRRRTVIEHGWHSTWQPCSDPTKPHIATVLLKTFLKVGNMPVPLTEFNLHIEQIGPAVVHLFIDSPVGKAVCVQTIVPEGPLQHRLIHQLYSESRILQWLSNKIFEMIEAMVARDVIIWNNKIFQNKPILLKEDKQIKRFRRWYSQFYSKSSPTLEDVFGKALQRE